MTTVVAAARGGAIAMAADSQTNVYDRPIYGALKLVELHTAKANAAGSRLVLGVTGHGSLLGTLRQHLRIDSLPTSGADAWADAVADAVMQLAAERSQIRDDDGQLDGSVLLGAVGRLWTISSPWAVPHHDGVAAIGSGEGPAIGALHVLLAHGHELTSAVAAACRVAIRYDRHSGGHVNVAEVPARHAEGVAYSTAEVDASTFGPGHVCPHVE